MAPSILITGAPFTGSASDPRPNRRDIYDFVGDETQFSLYVQALRNIYSRPESVVNSYYAVAGIHGFPYEEWNDSGSSQPPPGTPAMGYCTHRNTLFPTWHRPYVFFFEQLIQAEAATIANTYTPALRATFQNAASVLRQPYWDWAANALPPVQVYQLDTISYRAPNGNIATMANPFRRYAFQNNSHQSFPNSPYNQWPTTLRQPTSTSASATDNIPSLTSKLLANGNSIRNRMYSTLTNVHTWPQFSNARTQAGSPADSIEAIHDDIHVLVGGIGHMGDISTAGFDPIFYLHHCNVDRMIALWSALNPGVWVSQDNTPSGTWTIQAGSTIGATSDLTPFWRTSTTYWNSNDVLTTSVGGYSYPDFNSISVSASASETQTAIAARVNQLYGQSNRGVANANSSVWEWQARVSFNSQEYGTSFEVLIFLGEGTENSTEGYDSSSYVGARYAWANSFMADEPALAVETSGYIPLNDAIIEHGNISSLDPQSVTPYLDRALSWRAQTPLGEFIPREQVRSLNVSISGTPVKPGMPMIPQSFEGVAVAGHIGGA
ncbi:Di-copper centre-containing protein [Cylindrobasidium torrendii FP15055 ss-10]|uniref:tyrosinase n=1 Tax=Cylindrobasidium torrendii FP15055 ss-10 TaxID=1314674 RepID=A0A0D7AWR7_9AGAR|nr:Di-copper centre-containing protein [Cylindrobasidium torrendii FP15055 ss-10]